MKKDGKMCWGHWVAWILVIIGGLNWGLVGAFDYNLVNALLGNVAWLERLVYILVGLSALVLIFGCRCKKCMVGKGKGAKKMDMPAGGGGSSEGEM